MKTTFLIADDHKILRDGLRRLLLSNKDFLIIGEASNGKEAIDFAFLHVPDFIIMDISMPEINGVEATRTILNKYPEIKIIVLSMHSEKRYIFRMLDAGVKGYLMKDCAFEELLHAIEIIRMGKRYLSNAIPQSLRTESFEHQRMGGRERRSFELTPRERQVLKLIAEGNTPKEITTLLNVSIKTVDTHKMHIMKKTNAHSVADLVHYAIAEGIVTIKE